MFILPGAQSAVEVTSTGSGWLPLSLPSGMATPAVGEATGVETVYADSTLRKRRKKMNKHKHRKLRKRMRNKGGQNLKSD